MATSASSDVSSNQSWFTPLLLVLFCVIHLINYMDRGVISSNGVNGIPKTCGAHGMCTSGSGIQGQFKLTNFEDGILSSAFMVGLLLACPIFASLSKRINPFRLIGVGLSIWTLSVIGCGFSFNFWSIVVCRMIVGVGEASFISLAAPFIYDNAPAHKCVRPSLRPLSMAMSTVAIHIFGDVPSSPLVGVLEDHLNNWRKTTLILTTIFFPAAIIWFIGKC
ncbi:probable sphingolipid transporter spinster homolog 2 [Cucurbita maxima]|uniref:Probable sphingolipid transporter spinster homolog 2 n=1 Tax=Cucurbita maxima TaxID=3661 RepID=A0A6J1I8J3_CUCMA|nr:probable sphingolipid transporter spinster homolog 2 [Cucurbita maxima]